MNVVVAVFPTTKHRLCLWHIIKKFSERLSHIYHDTSKFKQDLNHCIHESISTSEFESSWEGLVTEYNLAENEWLTNLYSMRSLWVACFNKSVFFGEMSTTGKSESMNAYFDAYVKSRMTLNELILKCEEAIDDRYEKFRRAEFDSHKVPILTLHMGLEKHASSVYTSEAFKIFHNELKGILGCKQQKQVEVSTSKIYSVAGESDSRQVLVEYDTITKEATCECMLFEFKGILCKHILSIFYVHNVDIIPSKYIMNRWTRDVTNPIFACNVASRARLQTSMGSFELKELFEELYDMTELSDAILKHVKESRNL